MINKINKDFEFIKGFDQIAESVKKEGQPSWLNEKREQSINRFLELGMPTVKDEEWKYTSLKDLMSKQFSISSTSEFNEDKELAEYLDNKDINLVFINGIFNVGLSSFKDLENGLTITNLKEAYAENELNLEALLKKYDVKNETAFVSLNNAIALDGTYIKIEKNSVIKKLIHIVHVTSSSVEQLTNPHTIISLEESSEANVLESHISFNDDSRYLSNALTDIFLEESSNLKYCKAQKESLNAYHIGNTRVIQKRNSVLDGFSLICGAKITRNNLDIILDGEGINSTLNGLYSLYGEQHADNHTSVHHREESCQSNQLYKGILNGSARAVFNGKIFVHQKAQKTNSYQLNKNLLLGDKCRIDTKPQLEIFADDVKCTHGATVGQLDEDELFYLQTRSIARTAAIKMLAHGFVDDLLSQIKSEDVKRKLQMLLKPSFAQL